MLQEQPVTLGNVRVTCSCITSLYKDLNIYLHVFYCIIVKVSVNILVLLAAPWMYKS